MNGQQIIDKFHNYVSDQLDTDFELQLANDAMHDIEEEVMPEGLKKVDASDSTSSGQTYTTGVTLPTDFYAAFPYIYIGQTKYYQIPFEQSVEYRDISGYYYVDVANNTYHLTGTQGSVQTITFPYFYATADITLSTSPVWPTQFHSLIPLKMAQIYFAIDQNERGRSWDDKWEEYYTQRLNRFRDYDAKQKLNAINFSVSPTTLSDSENRVNI